MKQLQVIPQSQFFASRIRLTSIPFNSLFSRQPWVSRHQKGKPFWSLIKQEMMGWPWSLGQVQIICTSFQSDNDVSTSLLSFHRLDALPDTQPTQIQSSESFH